FTHRVDETWEQANHYLLMLMVALVRLAAGDGWSPREVRLQTGQSSALRDFPPLAETHADFAQPATPVAFARSVLAQPVRAGAAGAGGAPAPAEGRGDPPTTSPARSCRWSRRSRGRAIRTSAPPPTCSA